MALAELFNGIVPRDIPGLYGAYDAAQDEIVQVLSTSLRRYLDENVDSAELDKTKVIPEKVLKDLGELGGFGLAIAEEYEGAGLNMEGFCHVMREIAAGDPSVGVTIGAHSAIGTHGIKIYGTDEQKKTYLPDIATGRAIAAFAITEAEAGSDLANISTKAVLSEDGKTFTINGRKLFITNGGFAGTVTFLAKTPGLARTADSTGLFIIQSGTPGFSVGPPEDKLGIRASSTTELIFENVVLPRENLIGNGINGLELVKGVLNWGRMCLSAGCWGAMELISRMAGEHATRRVQFEEPIGSFGIVKHMVSDIVASTYAVESMITVTSKLFDAAPERAGMATSATKVFASTLASEATDLLVQIFGGMGFIEEAGAARLFRDARINKIYEGTNEIIKYLTALEGVVSISGKMDGDSSIEGLLHGDLKALAGPFDRSLKIFHEHALGARKKYGIRIRNRQLVLERIVDMAIDVYALFCVLVNTSYRLSTLGEDRSARAVAVARKMAAEISGRIDRIASLPAEDWDGAVEEIARLHYERFTD